MKKIISLVLAVAMVATMFTAVVPVYAADASITLSTNSVAVNADGSYGNLTATITGISASADPWVAFILKSDWTGTYVSQSHTGWWQFVAGQVADGTVLDLSWATRVHSSKGVLEIGKEYVVVLMDGNTVAATAEFTTTKGFASATVAQTGLYGTSAAGVNVGQASAVTTTYFTANAEFSGVAFNAWTTDPGTTWKFELVKVAGSEETVVDTATGTVSQDYPNTVEFAAQQAGTYGFRISAVDGYVDGNYMILPVAPVASNSYISNVYTTIYDCATESADALAAQTSAAAIAVYMTGNATVTPEPATDVTVELAIMDTTDDLYNAVSELKEGTVYQVDAYLTGYTSASDAIAGLEVNIPFDQYTSTFIATSEKTGYSFDGTTNFATLVTPEGSDVATSAKFASVYGTQGDSGFVYSRLEDTDSNPTDGRIQLFAYTFRLVEGATGEITFPVEIIASGSDLIDYGYTAETVTLPVAGSVDTGDTTPAFQSSFDYITADGVTIKEPTDGVGIGGVTKFDWTTAGLPVPVASESLVISGWTATENGIEKYQYSINGGEWTDIDFTPTDRSDLTAANIPYSGGHSTAGMTDLTIPLTAATLATGNTVDLRFVDKAGNTAEIIQFVVDKEVVFTEYRVNIDYLYTDYKDDGSDVSTTVSKVAGFGLTDKVIDLGTITATTNFKITGWNINSDGGTAKFQYSVNGGEWADIPGTTGTYNYPNISTNAGFGADSGNDWTACDSTGGISIVCPVTDIAAGTTGTIDLRAVSATNGYVYDAITVDVTVPEAAVEPTTYNVSVGTVTNGTVTVDKATVTEGETVTVTATPSAGYTLTAILVNGTAISGNTFVPTADSVVTATFTAINYTITAGTATNGTVTVDKSTATIGQTVTVTATPATGYQLGQILVNGTAISGNTFTVSGDSTVTATFTAINYTITVGTATNGTVTVDKTTATIGQTVTVTATPSEGYELDAILVDGSAITGNTFTVSGNATVTATFKAVEVAPTTYTITIVTGGKGAGNVTIATTAAAGETVTFTTTPTVTSAGYASVCTLISTTNATVTTTAASTGSFTGGSFVMPAEDVTITVNFQVLGDVTLDGSIKANDLAMLKKYIGGSYELTAERLLAANVVGGNDANVKANDLAAMKKYVGGGMTQFGNGSYS